MTLISDYIKNNFGIDIEEPDVEVHFDSVIKFLQVAILKLQDVHYAALDDNHFLIQNKLRLVKNISKEEDDESKLSLQCSICETRYDTAERRPLVLLCGHTFCKDCHIKSFNQVHHVQCFVCRRNFSSTYKAVAEIGQNIEYSRVIEAVREQKKARLEA